LKWGYRNNKGLRHNYFLLRKSGKYIGIVGTNEIGIYNISTEYYQNVI